MDLESIKYVQAKNYTKGRSVPPSLIVIHDMEAGEYSTTAENCASYFAGANAPRASAHYSCDNDSTVCSVKPDDTAWHTGHTGTNNCGIGIEQAGYASQSPDDWADGYSTQMIEGQVGPLVRALCDRYGIPVRFLDANALRGGEFSGITSHREISFAFVKGGHTDPGPDYPWDKLFNAIDSSVGTTPFPTPPSTSGVFFGLGSTGQKVKDIQKVVGVPQDGVYGPVTASGVTSWQRNLQIPADGIWGPRTEEATKQFFDWIAAQNHPAPSGEGDEFLQALAAAQTQVLSSGSKGGAVSMAQIALNLKNFPVVADGVFGPKTFAAVRNFQASNNLVVDGIVGPRTWQKLVA
jgi:peptidoglycan hydrolase-like protein with peptidoglycan-binding domain